MSRRPKIMRLGNLTGLYITGACCVAIGVLLFGLSVLNNPASEPIGEVSPPSVANAPEPAEKPAAEEPKEKKEENKEEKKEEKKEPVEEAQEQEESAAIPAAAGTDLYLTVPKMGLVDDYVVNDASEATLLNGAGKVPETGFPWQEGANTYIASHVLGYSGTGSEAHFAALPNMTYGDEIVLTDTNGTTYTYAVNEILTVTPYDVWVLDPIAGQNTVSLQTCVNPPAYDMRLIVRAERVDVDVA